jgi:hypothetical protein
VPATEPLHFTFQAEKVVMKTRTLARIAAPLAILAVLGGAAHADSGSGKGKGKPVNATFGAGPSTATGRIDGRGSFDFTTTPGSQTLDHLAILNISRVPERLVVYSVDAVPATDGTISFPNQDAKRLQAGAWVSIGTPDGSSFVNVKPRSTIVLPLRIVVPPNASPGDHIGAVVVALNGKLTGAFGSGGSQNVTFQQRLAIKTVFRVSGPLHPKLVIDSLSASYRGRLDPFAAGDVLVRYRVRNEGNVVLAGPQTVAVTGLFGQHAQARGVAALPPLLPGASYPVTVRVHGVWPEIWESAKVTVGEIGLAGQVTPGLHSVSTSANFWAVPWVILLVVLALLLMIFAYVRKRRRRRTAAAGAGRHRQTPAHTGAAL